MSGRFDAGEAGRAQAVESVITDRAVPNNAALSMASLLSGKCLVRAITKRPPMNGC